MFKDMMTGKIRHGQEKRSGKVWSLSVLISAIIALAGCSPYAHHVVPNAEAGETAGTAKTLSTQVYFYPKMGQTTEQQSRDHFDCYNWAVKQTGFDPGQSSMPAAERVRIVPMPSPGHDTAAFAIAGAVLGALIGGPRHAAGGAIIGASGGALIGAASDTSRMESARQQEEIYVANDRAREARMEGKTAGFRRAMSACLEGRGYSVR